MNNGWAIAGLVYAAAYAALMAALPAHPWARLVIGNIALLLPPLAPLYILVRRRGDWRGREAIFWAAIGSWAGSTTLYCDAVAEKPAAVAAAAPAGVTPGVAPGAGVGSPFIKSVLRVLGAPAF